VVAAEVARAYFRLIASDAQVSLLRDTLKSRSETVVLQKDRYQAGVIGDFDLNTAEAEAAAVASDIALAVRIQAENESALAVLLGRSPREVYEPKFTRDVQMVWLMQVPTLPPGLPSDLLARRPDIRDAEKQLAAANQRIDVARADYYPQLTLTGSYGSESNVLKSLFSGPAMIWGIGAGLLQPIIGLKLVDATVELRTAQRDGSVINYRQAVQAAFRDTHDALVANQTTREALDAQSVRRDKLQKSLELANLRYTSGYSPYLEVLDVQRQLLQAQTLQILAARDVRLAVVDVAKALGGGWDYKTDVAGP
jgi:multidrug efflux system outer membrane protein